MVGIRRAFPTASLVAACSGVVASCIFAERTATAHIPANRQEDPDYDPDAANAPNPPPDPHAYPFAPRPEPRSDVIRLEGDALHAQIPDLVVRPWPPPLRLLWDIGTHYPLQAGGIGVGVEAYPTDFLRVSAYYSAGIAGIGQDLTFSNYAQALVGLRLFGVSGTYNENITADPTAPVDQPGKTLYQAALPALHALFIEGGMLTGSVPRYKCTSKCTPPDSEQSTFAVVNPQLFYPMAGLRYVFNTSASSKAQPRINRDWQIQVYGDVLFQPLNDSKEPLFWSNYSPVQNAHIGGMVGLTFPICTRFCVWPSLMGGYLPAPGSAVFGLGIGG